MKKFDHYGNDDVIFKDMIMLMLMGFIVLFFILIPFINPGKKDESKNEETKSPGSLIIYGYWNNGTDVDLDLWIKPPNDVAVGFPNRENHSCNLLRDDLGMTADITVNNFENIYCRDVYEGEYILNMHVYSFKEDKVNKVDLVVKIELVDFDENSGRFAGNFIGSRMRKIKFQKDLRITVYREDNRREFTLIRFSIDEKGNVIEDSINNEFISIIRSY